MKISPHAIVDPKAEIASDVEIGPFSVIGPDVKIGPGTHLLNNVTVMGHTTLGKNNVVFPNCVLGAPPQDRKYKGAPTRLEIGDGNQIRESTTMHCGTEKGGGITRVANNNLIMINAHVGHDTTLGSNCTVSNNVMIAGHCVIGDYVVISGGTGLHHFVTVDDFVFIGALSRVHFDVAPYTIVDGADVVRGINRVGLRRAGVAESDIEALEEASRRLFYREQPVALVIKEMLAANESNPYVKRMIEFIRRRDQGVHGRYLESLRKK